MSEQNIELGAEEPVQLGAEEPLTPAPTDGQDHGDNLGIAPMPSRDQHLAMLASFKATAGLSPEQGTQVLDHAKATGLQPDFVAGALPEVKQQADQARIADAVQRAPKLAAYMSQDRARASIAADDVDNLSALEFWATGRAGDPAAFDALDRSGPLFGGPRFSGASMPGWLAAVGRGALGLASSLGDTVEAITGTRPAWASKELADVAAAPIEGATTLPRRAAVAVAGVAPTFAALGAASLGGSEAMFAGLFATSYGKLHRSATDAGLPPDQADAFAAVAATIGARLGSGPASTMVGAAGRDAADASAAAIAQKMLAKPELLQTAAEMGRHILAGVGMNVAMAVSDELTLQIAKEYSKGRPLDASMLARTALDAAEDGLAFAPFAAAGPALDHVRQLGQAAEAARAKSLVESLAAAAQDSRMRARAPDEFEQLVTSMLDGTGQETVHVPADKLGAAAVLVDPALLAEAQHTGAPVPVDTAALLARAPEEAARLSADAKFDPAGQSVNEAKKSVELDPLFAKERTAANKAEAAPQDHVDPVGFARARLAERAIGDIRPDVNEQIARSAQQQIEAATTAETQATGALAARDPAAAPGKDTADLDYLRQVNEAMAAEGRKAAAAAGKLADRITVLVVDTTRARIGQAGPEYLGGFDAIAEAVGARPRSGTQLTVEDTLKRLDATDEPLGFDVDAVRDLVQRPRPFERLTLGEAKNVRDALTRISKAASDALEIEVQGKRQALRDAVARVREHLQAVPDEPAVKPGNQRAGGVLKLVTGVSGESLRSGAQALVAENTKPELLIEKVLGDVGKGLFDEYLQSRAREDALRAEVGEPFQKLLEHAPKEFRETANDGVDGPPTSRVDRGRWVRADLRRLFGWMGTKSGAQRASGGLGLSEAEIHAAFEQLTKSEMDVQQGLWDLHDNVLWPKIAAHEAERSGLEPPKLEAQEITTQHGKYRGGYEHATYNREATLRAIANESRDPLARAEQERLTAQPGGGPVSSIADYWGDLRRGVARVEHGFTKSRVPRFFAVPDLSWEGQASNIEAQIHYLAFDKYVRNMGRLIRDPELRGVVLQKYGPDVMRQLDEHLITAARGGVEPVVSGAKQWASVVGGSFVRKVATAAFQLNAPVALAQLSHIPGAMVALRVRPDHMARGVFEALQPWKWGEAHAHSLELPDRWNDYSGKMRELLEGVKSEQRSELRKLYDGMSWSMYHAMDGFLSQAFWHAGRARALSEGATSVEAAKAADQLVRDAMPPLRLAERGSYARDRGVLGSLVLVRNFPATLFNWWEWNRWRAQTGVWESSPGWDRAKALIGGTAAGAAAALGGTLAVHTLGQYLLGHGRREDEGWKQWWARMTLGGIAEPVPLAGEVSQLLANATMSRKPFSQEIRQHGDLRAAPSIALLQDTIRGLGDALDRRKPNEDRLFAGSEVLMRLRGIPVAEMRPGKYVFDAVTGKLRPRGPADAAGGLIYGKRKHQASNPLSDLSRALRE